MAFRFCADVFCFKCPVYLPVSEAGIKDVNLYAPRNFATVLFQCILLQTFVDLNMFKVQLNKAVRFLLNCYDCSDLLRMTSMGCHTCYKTLLEMYGVPRGHN